MGYFIDLGLQVHLFGSFSHKTVEPRGREFGVSQVWLGSPVAPLWACMLPDISMGAFCSGLLDL